MKYGFGVLGTCVQFKLNKWGMVNLPRFSKDGKKLEPMELPASSIGHATAR